MKRFYLFPVLALALAVGCHSQVPPNPTVYVCPPSTGSAYTPLNQSTPTTGLTYTDTKPPAGVHCYIAQSVIGSQVSNPSNTAGPLTLSGSNSTQLTWSAPASGPLPSGYVLSRAQAVATTLLAPALGNGSVALLDLQPLPVEKPVVAGAPDPARDLVASVR